MKRKVKKISPALFGIIIICFFMPFIEVTCSGQKAMSITGIQMVTGTSIQQPSMFGENTKGRKIDPEPLAIITFSSVIIGLLLSFMNKRKSAILPAIIAGIGTITLLLLKSKIDNDVLREGSGMIQVVFVFGFWATFLLLIIAVGLNIYVFSGKDVIKKKLDVRATPNAAQETVRIARDEKTDQLKIRFSCKNCGSKYIVDSKYSGRKAKCKKCGSDIQIPHS